MFVCEICGKECSSMLSLGGHKGSHKRLGMKIDKTKIKTTVSGPRPCKHCGKVVEAKKMGRHVQHHHRPVKQFHEMSRANKKQTLLEEKNFSCWECGIKSWNGRAIVLELDHIDGNPENNVRENLRILCPNCHSQTPTYRFKNRGKHRDNSWHKKQAEATKKVRKRKTTVSSMEEQSLDKRST